jgi:hypothetical protein
VAAEPASATEPLRPEEEVKKLKVPRSCCSDCFGQMILSGTPRAWL